MEAQDPTEDRDKDEKPLVSSKATNGGKET